ncbi:MAG TPA: class I SAM-dependent methyltransferase [Thermoanaerobaculia bacterium]
MRRFRGEAYGEDIGQHSWVTAEELRGDIPRLALSRSSRLLDLGCGPCGPLTFVVSTVGCEGAGADQSAPALDSGRARAASLGIEDRISLRQADLDEPLPFASGSFEAVMALDVVIHLRSRVPFFREVARILNGGRFLLTDAGVKTGPVKEEEAIARSMHGVTQLVAPGENEANLEAAGFRLLEREDRTASVVRNASGRLSAIAAHRQEFEEILGKGQLERQLRYLETVRNLSQRGSVSRFMYLAEAPSI